MTSRHNDVIGCNECLISAWSKSTIPWVYSLQFLADRTNGRAIATLLRLSSSAVCLWRYVLWLNGAS